MSTSMDLGEGPPESLVAPEDMAIIMAVVNNLTEAKKVFRINLPHGAYLTNHEGGPVFSFSGIDQIREAWLKLAEVTANAPIDWILLMPTDNLTRRMKIGNLFGMDVFADPDIDKNNFVIQERPKPT